MTIRASQPIKACPQPARGLLRAASVTRRSEGAVRMIGQPGGGGGKQRCLGMEEEEEEAAREEGGGWEGGGT